MSTRILVGYASEFGSTAAVADRIAMSLRSAGVNVDVRLVTDVADLTAYDAAIIGSAVYNGAWLPEATYFVQYFAAELSRIPVAYFAVCMTIKDNTEEQQRAARTFLEPLLHAVPHVKPIDMGLFGGHIETGKLPIPLRLRIRLTTTLRNGDYRDWAAIEHWTAQLRPGLLSAAH